MTRTEQMRAVLNAYLDEIAPFLDRSPKAYQTTFRVYDDNDGPAEAVVEIQAARTNRRAPRDMRPIRAVQ